MSYVISLLILGLFNPLLIQCIYSKDAIQKKPPLHREKLIDNWFYREKINSQSSNKTRQPLQPNHGVTIHQNYSRVEVNNKNQDLINFPPSPNLSDENYLNDEGYQITAATNIISEDQIIFPDAFERLTKIIDDYISDKNQAVISKDLNKSDTIKNTQNFETVIDNPIIFNPELNFKAPDLTKASKVTDVFDILLKDTFGKTFKDRITFQDSYEEENSIEIPEDNYVTDKELDTANYIDKIFVRANVPDESTNTTNNDLLSLDNELEDDLGFTVNDNDFNNTSISNFTSSIEINDSNKNVTSNESNEIMNTTSFYESYEINTSYEIINVSELIFKNIENSNKWMQDELSQIQRHNASSLNEDDVSISVASVEVDYNHTLSNETYDSVEIIEGREKEKFLEGKALFERCTHLEYPISAYERRQRYPCKNITQDNNIFSDENTDFSYNDEQHVPIPTNVSKDLKLMNISESITHENKVLTLEDEIHCDEGYTGLVPIESDCRKFINCWKGTPYVMTCGPGTVFNRVKNVCDHTPDGECKGIKPNFEYQNNKTESKTLDSNIIPSTKHASKLLLVDTVYKESMLQEGGNAPMIGTARQAKYFPTYQAESDLQNIDKEVYIGDECPPGATGQFVYAYDCRQFLNCWNGRGYIQPCALGTLFNPETLECDHAHKVDCLHSDFSAGGFGNKRNEQLTASRSHIGMNQHQNQNQNQNMEPKCQPGASGIFPHPGDCTKFLNCAHGRTFIQQCGPGTAFNPLVSVCDYAHNVGCDIPNVAEGPKDDYDYESIRARPSTPMRYHVSDRRPGRPGKNLQFESSNPQFISSNRLGYGNQGQGGGIATNLLPPRPSNQYASHQNPYDRPMPHAQLVPPPPMMTHHHSHHEGGHHRGHRGPPHPDMHHQHNQYGGDSPQYNIRGQHRPAVYDQGHQHNYQGNQRPEIHNQQVGQGMRGNQPSYGQHDHQSNSQQHGNRENQRPSGSFQPSRPVYVNNHPSGGATHGTQPSTGQHDYHGGSQQHGNRQDPQPSGQGGYQPNRASTRPDPYAPASSNTHTVHQRPENARPIPQIPPPNIGNRDERYRPTTPRREDINRTTTPTPHYIHTVPPRVNVQGYRNTTSYGQNRPDTYNPRPGVNPVYDRTGIKTDRVNTNQTYNPWNPSIPVRPRIDTYNRTRVSNTRNNTADCIQRRPGDRRGPDTSTRPYDGYYNPKPTQGTGSNRDNREPVYCDELPTESVRYGGTQPPQVQKPIPIGAIPIPAAHTTPVNYYPNHGLSSASYYSPTPIVVVVTPPSSNWQTTPMPVPAAVKSSNIMKIPPRNAKSNPLRPEISETMGKIIQMMYFGNKDVMNITTPSTLELDDEFEELELANNNRQVKKILKPTKPLSVLPLEHQRPHFIEKSPADCADGHFRCDGSKCITLSRICNKIKDCDDGTDEEQCEERIGYEIRLTGSNSSNEGRVEVKAFGVWGSICDDKFGLRDADVICKELGFKLGAAQAKFPIAHNESESTVFLMDDLDCLGNETSIRECQFNGWGVHDCLPEEAAGVVCRTPAVTCPQDFWLCSTNDECIPTSFLCDNVQDCADGSDESNNICNEDIEIRLANGPNKLEGRVEVKFRGIWGTVCDDDFTDKAAQVVCRMLGYAGPAKAKKEGAYGAGTGQIWLDQVACFGNESSITQCMHWQWGENNCGHSEDVGVVCSNMTNKQEHGRGLSLDDSTIDFVDDNYLQSGNSGELLPAECGVRINHNKGVEDDVAFRVVRGSLAKIGDYPWQASLRVRGPAQSAHWCGAVLISKLHLLTAAHCLVAFSKGAYFIRVGDHDAVEMEVYIEEFYVHEEFRKGQHMNNDIALIKLKSGGVPLGKWIRPICLPPKEVQYTPGKNCTISGWGSIQTGKSSPSNQLRAGWVPLQPMSVCRMPQVYGAAITEGMVCAGELDEGVDACDGDSGGPLACLHDGVYTLFGITSWGQHCGHANKPGVYVKVAHYRDWIDEKIKMSLTEQ